MLDGLTFCGLVVGHAVTINIGVVEGVWGADGVAVGKRVTKYMGVDVADAVIVPVEVADDVRELVTVPDEVRVLVTVPVVLAVPVVVADTVMDGVVVAVPDTDANS